MFRGSLTLSTCYHALPSGKSKRVFKRIEHSAIFLLIAGTYTPLTLGVLRGALGWTLLELIWFLAAIGVVLKLCNRLTHPIASTGLYLLMGWLIVVAANPLYLNYSPDGLYWLVAGGFAYTAGFALWLTIAFHMATLSGICSLWRGQVATIWRCLSTSAKLLSHAHNTR